MAKLRRLALLAAGLVAGLASRAAAPLPAGASAIVVLWPQGAPGSQSRRNEPETVVNGDITNEQNPAVVVFLPKVVALNDAGHSTGAGAVVMPGGGHRKLNVEREGYAVGRWLAAHGVAAFVLKYRLAKAPGSIYRVEVEELADARRSMRVVRSRAAGWGVDPKRVGVLGFAAGGQLASLLSERFDTGIASAKDPIDHWSCKPAFQALIYPDDCEDVAANAQSPPAFLVAGFDDVPDISQGIARAYLLFQNVGVSAELHIYAGAGHGFALDPGPARSWADRFRAWLTTSGLANGR